MTTRTSPVTNNLSFFCESVNKKKSTKKFNSCKKMTSRWKSETKEGERTQDVVVVDHLFRGAFFCSPNTTHDKDLFPIIHYTIQLTHYFHSSSSSSSYSEFTFSCISSNHLQSSSNNNSQTLHNQLLLQPKLKRNKPQSEQCHFPPATPHNASMGGPSSSISSPTPNINNGPGRRRGWEGRRGRRTSE